MIAEILIKLDDIEEDEDEEDTAWATAGDFGFLLLWRVSFWEEPDSGGVVIPVGDEAYLQIEIS